MHFKWFLEFFLLYFPEINRNYLEEEYKSNEYLLFEFIGKFVVLSDIKVTIWINKISVVIQ